MPAVVRRCRFQPLDPEGTSLLFVGFIEFTSMHGVLTTVRDYTHGGPPLAKVEFGVVQDSTGTVLGKVDDLILGEDVTAILQPTAEGFRRLFGEPH